ncbi:hypothetical protein F4819DRAFT_468788 [Hypoxylon fuscum]|nr:hypothetical protein F4819DRAFT_468788 [Hypoxylon fuscum]
MKGNLIHWSSMKCRRATRSVLASEIYAMIHGVDMATAIGTTITSIHENKNKNTEPKEIRQTPPRFLLTGAIWTAYP